MSETDLQRGHTTLTARNRYIYPSAAPPPVDAARRAVVRLFALVVRVVVGVLHNMFRSSYTSRYRDDKGRAIDTDRSRRVRDAGGRGSRIFLRETGVIEVLCWLQCPRLFIHVPVDITYRGVYQDDLKNALTLVLLFIFNLIFLIIL